MRDASSITLHAFCSSFKSCLNEKARFIARKMIWIPVVLLENRITVLA